MEALSNIFTFRALPLALDIKHHINLGIISNELRKSDAYINDSRLEYRVCMDKKNDEGECNRAFKAKMTIHWVYLDRILKDRVFDFKSFTN